MKNRLIFSAHMANYLYKNGFKIIDTQLNFKQPDHLVYVFEDTPELRQAMTDYTNAKQGEEK